ncbi:unnamed protein product [Calicophoron daubneyi]|uniref:DUF676 domain-containing protein n=1 Tax=Calicophoron daubneyi TaxID=300641 RepID=A0AAV2T9I3_CALDB
MPVVQATVSFVVELREFHNVDLYHRGYYQIRTHLKANAQSSASGAVVSKSTAFVEPPTLWKRASTRVKVPEAVQSSYIDPGSTSPSFVPQKGCSKTLLIMYKEESAKLYDVFEQHILVQVDPTHIEESMAKHEMCLCVELWFAEEGSLQSTVLCSMEKLFERQLRVHLNVSRGLHHHFNVFFDYFHLCAIEVGLHAALTNISPSIISLQKTSPRATPLQKSSSQMNLVQQSWHTILFNLRNHLTSCVCPQVANSSRIQLASAVHRHVCHTLLSARESMLLFWREILPYLPAHHRPHIKVTDFVAKLQDMTSTLMTQTTDEDLANQISLDISKLSSQNTALLHQLCKSAVLQTKVANYLRTKTHQVRMKRFAEAFFCQELSLVHLLSVYDPNNVGHESVATDVRQSLYFQQLPSLPVSCRELDGDSSTLPIIFEDVYLPPNAQDSQRVPWRSGPNPEFDCKSLPGCVGTEVEPPERGDSPDTPLTNSATEAPSSFTHTSEEDVDKDKKHTKVKVSVEQNEPNLLDVPKRNSSSLIRENKILSKSTPTLTTVGLSRTSTTLPPVLRHIGHSRRRYRPSSFHGRRSVLFGRAHTASTLPDSLGHGSVKLIGFRTAADPLEEAVVDSSPLVSRPVVSGVVRLRHVGSDVAGSPVRPVRMYLGARDLRSRSLVCLNSVCNQPSTLNFKASAQSPTAYHSRNSTLQASNSVGCASQSSQRHSLSVERLDNLRDHLDATAPRTLTLSRIHNRVVSRASNGSQLQSARFSLPAPSTCNSERTIGLGTLSKPPLLPPGGCIPPVNLSNGVTACQPGGNNMDGRLSANTLSSLSVPNLSVLSSLTHLESESLGTSFSTIRKIGSRSNSRRSSSHLSRRHSHSSSKRPNSVLCKTYTSDLAFLGSYSDLELAVLEEANSRWCILRGPGSFDRIDSPSQRLSFSSSNLVALSSGRTSNSNQMSVELDSPPCDNCVTGNFKVKSVNRNNVAQWIRPCCISDTVMSPTNETADDETKPKASNLSQGEASFGDLRKRQKTSSDSLPVCKSDESVPNTQLQNKSRPRPKITLCRASSTNCTLSSGHPLTETISPQDSVLNERGYQVLDDGSDDEKRIKGTEPKVSILELLREDGKRHAKVRNYSEPVNAYGRTKAVSLPAWENSLMPDCVDPAVRSHPRSLIEPISPGVMDFLRLKESIKRQVALNFQGHIYSDFATVASPYAYFSDLPLQNSDDLHLIVCVHGLDGNGSDLRLVRVYLELALPDCHLEFLMSECNQSDTFADFDTMRDNLVQEILSFIDELDEPPTRISFIGHSMGCVLIRAALLSARMIPYLPKLHAFLSLSGPHLGTVYNSSGLINMGMWVMQKWKKSASLSQLRLRDDPNLRNTYLYRLSASPGLDKFRYVLLVSSPQDRYVPYHSTRIELCKAAVRDNSSLGIVYMEMVTNLLQRLIKSPRTTVVRYDVHYALGNSTNNLIGRAAHIAVLDSEVFLEKFICVSGAKYFR